MKMNRNNNSNLLSHFEKYKLENLNFIKGGEKLSWNENTDVNHDYPNGDNIDFTLDIKDGQTGGEALNNIAQDGIGGGHCDSSIFRNDAIKLYNLC